jgi:hypothetical protein
MLTPPNLPLLRGGAAGGGVNSIQHDKELVLAPSFHASPPVSLKSPDLSLHLFNLPVGL